MFAEAVVATAGAAADAGAAGAGAGAGVNTMAEAAVTIAVATAAVAGAGAGAGASATGAWTCLTGCSSCRAVGVCPCVSADTESEATGCSIAELDRAASPPKDDAGDRKLSLPETAAAAEVVEEGAAGAAGLARGTAVGDKADTVSEGVLAAAASDAAVAPAPAEPGPEPPTTGSAPAARTILTHASHRSADGACSTCTALDPPLAAEGVTTNTCSLPAQ